MNAAIAIAIDKTCAMGSLRRPYAGGEHDELGLVNRVADQALLLEPVQRIPIKPLPGPPVVMAGQKEERQHRFVDLVLVERHPPTVPVSFELRWGSWPHAYGAPAPGEQLRGVSPCRRATPHT